MGDWDGREVRGFFEGWVLTVGYDVGEGVRIVGYEVGEGVPIDGPPLGTEDGVRVGDGVGLELVGPKLGARLGVILVGETVGFALHLVVHVQPL